MCQQAAVFCFCDTSYSRVANRTNTRATVMHGSLTEQLDTRAVLGHGYMCSGIRQTDRTYKESCRDGQMPIPTAVFSAF
jgi:hypothetical protein